MSHVMPPLLPEMPVKTLGMPTTVRRSPGGGADVSSALRQGLTAAVAIALLAACSKKEEAVIAPAPTPKPQPEAISHAQVEAEVMAALPDDPKNTEAAETDSLAAEAESLLDKYPGKTAVELLNLPEVKESFRVSLTRLAENKALQGQINSSVELAAKLKGLEGTPGSVGLDLDTKNYNRDQKSRMLQAVLSEDPKRVVGFLVGEIGTAVPELTYEGASRASNGVAIKENPPPAK